MKTAKLYAAGIEVHCPHCGDSLPDPVTGSFVWEVHQVQAMAGMARVCQCGRAFIFKKNPSRVAV